MSVEQQPYDNTIWLSFSRWTCMDQFIHVCVETRCNSVSCDDRARCEVDLLLLQSTWKMLSTLACLRNHRTFRVGHLNAAKSPAHKVSILRWDRCHTHMSTLNGITFLFPWNHTGMLCNALVSVPQLSRVMLKKL